LPLAGPVLAHCNPILGGCYETNPRARESWVVYRIGTCERVGAFVEERTFNVWLGAVGGRVFFVEDRRTPDGKAWIPVLRVRDLKTGKFLWQRPAAPPKLGLPLGSPG
jgi:hypothetical protein